MKLKVFFAFRKKWCYEIFCLKICNFLRFFQKNNPNQNIGRFFSLKKKHLNQKSVPNRNHLDRGLPVHIGLLAQGLSISSPLPFIQCLHIVLCSSLSKCMITSHSVQCCQSYTANTYSGKTVEVQWNHCDFEKIQWFTTDHASLYFLPVKIVILALFYM